MHPLTYQPPQPRLLELSGEEWFALVAGSAAVALACFIGFPDLSVWTALGVWLTCFVLGHMCMTVARHVAFPDLIVFAACLQWLIGPWVSSLYPPTLPVFKTTLPLDTYMQYAVPATLALWLGLHLPVSRRLARSWSLTTLPPMPPRIRRTMDLLIVMGMAVATFGTDLLPWSYAYLVYLIGLVRFVAVIGWMVTRTPGWGIRIAIVGLHFAALQSASGLFYALVHWAGYLLLVFAFMRAWRWQLLVAIVIGLLSVGVLQDVKPTFRQSLATGSVSEPVDSFVELVSLMADRLTGRDPSSFQQPGDMLIRFNQGWIIARVMEHVPASEPYARGQTLIDATVFSILPRFLFPSKPQGASTELFSRYTGVTLTPGTTMGLGLIGEMYANFGGAGGIAGTFVYGVLIGWLFAAFAERALLNPMWWAIAAFVLVPSVEPGLNIEDITNHVVKAAVLLVAVMYFVPSLSRALAPLQPADVPLGLPEPQAG